MITEEAPEYMDKYEIAYKLDSKSFLVKTRMNEWMIIRPIKMNGQLNWPNLLYGGKKTNILIIIAAITILMFLVWSYAYDTKQCRELIKQLPKWEHCIDDYDVDMTFIKEGDYEFNPPLPTQDHDTQY